MTSSPTRRLKRRVRMTLQPGLMVEPLRIVNSHQDRGLLGQRPHHRDQRGGDDALSVVVLRWWPAAAGGLPRSAAQSGRLVSNSGGTPPSRSAIVA